MYPKTGHAPRLYRTMYLSNLNKNQYKCDSIKIIERVPFLHIL